MSYDARTDEAIVERQLAVIHSESSVRAAFLKKVYGLFFLGILIFAGVTAISTYISLKYAEFTLNNWFVFLIVFFVFNIGTGKMMADPHKGLAVLILSAIGWGVIFGPLMLIAFLVTGGWTVVIQALLMTVLVFGGLTGYVLITKEDFSFLKGFLTILGFFLLGVAIFSWFFGIPMGSIWGIIVPAGFILFFSMHVLYNTSIIMKKLPPQYAAAGAAMLFVDFAGLLYYMIMLLISLSGRD